MFCRETGSSAGLARTEDRDVREVVEVVEVVVVGVVVVVREGGVINPQTLCLPSNIPNCYNMLTVL